jgi:hypothetical protein
LTDARRFAITIASLIPLGDATSENFKYPAIASNKVIDLKEKF